MKMKNLLKLDELILHFIHSVVDFLVGFCALQ